MNDFFYLLHILLEHKEISATEVVVKLYEDLHNLQAQPLRGTMRNQGWSEAAIEKAFQLRDMPDAQIRQGDKPTLAKVRELLTTLGTPAAFQVSMSTKIEAIRLLREVTGEGLKECKDFVETCREAWRPVSQG
jgi:ribosomal protein L7/L12